MHSVSANRIAVLVIDVQVGLFCIDKPPFEADTLVARINSITAKARAANVPVIFVQHDGPPEGNWLVPFTKPWQLHPDLQRSAADIVVRKTMGDAFYRTNLEATLRASGVQTVVLVGYATDFCIDATLRNAASKDFEIFLVADAHTTNDTKSLNAAAIREHFNYVWADSSSGRGVHVLKTEELRFD